MFGHRFLVLLVLLLLLLVSIPVLSFSRHPIVMRFVTEVLFTAIILSAVFAVSERRMTVIIVWVLASLAIIAQITESLLGLPWLSLARYVLGILVLGYTVVLILGHLFSSRRVTLNMIYASLCAYLLIGLLWAVAYSLIYLVDPGAFNMNTGGIASDSSRQFGRISIEPIYYSLVTLTTLGYGDITPATPLARMFSAIEAVIGQMYIAVLVARLVGLHISQSQGSD